MQSFDETGRKSKLCFKTLYRLGGRTMESSKLFRGTILRSFITLCLQLVFYKNLKIRKKTSKHYNLFGVSLEHIFKFRDEKWKIICLGFLFQRLRNQQNKEVAQQKKRVQINLPGIPLCGHLLRRSATMPRRAAVAVYVPR